MVDAIDVRVGVMVRDEPRNTLHIRAPYLQSVVVFGRCRLLESGPEALALIKRLAMKYYPDERLADEEIAASGKAVQMYEITIEHLSGKEVQEK